MILKIYVDAEEEVYAKKNVMVNILHQRFLYEFQNKWQKFKGKLKYLLFKITLGRKSQDLQELMNITTIKSAWSSFIKK